MSQSPVRMSWAWVRLLRSAASLLSARSPASFEPTPSSARVSGCRSDFASSRTGRDEIWKMPADGGEAVQLTRSGGCWPRESWDGRFVYYPKTMGSSALWRVPADGGEETDVFAGPIWPWRWTLGRSGASVENFR